MIFNARRQAPRRRVLLVDDNAVSRSRCAATLERGGFDVIEARDGDEGFAKAISEKPDLIVCNLPENR